MALRLILRMRNLELKMKIELSKEHTEIALSSIERFFDEQMSTSIGNIEAKALLKFVMDEFGPIIYNKAIVDAQERIQLRAAELDIELYEEEFPYWRKQDSKSKSSR